MRGRGVTADDVAAHRPGDAAANLAGRRHLRRAAGVVGERARPARALDGHLDRAQRVVEGEVVEGQPRARVGAARRARQRVGEAGVIERRLLLLRVGVDHDELEAVGQRAPVIEAVRGADPGRRVGDEHRRRFVLLAQRLRALIVGRRDLGRRRRRHTTPGPQKAQNGHRTGFLHRLHHVFASV